jgi:mRNA-degrading endonuclease RelE of RelBE toxin-antitoxin system
VPDRPDPGSLPITLLPRAERDLRSIGHAERKRIVDALRSLAEAEGPGNPDVKALRGAVPWLRMRVGDYRVIYRATPAAYVVARIIHRRDLDRAVATLA